MLVINVSVVYGRATFEVPPLLSECLVIGPSACMSVTLVVHACGSRYRNTPCPKKN